MNSHDPSIPLQDLVLIGGGHAHVHVLKMLSMAKMSNLRVTLVSRDIDTPYSGMLPGYITGQYNYHDCHIDLVRLTSWARVRFIHAEVCQLDTLRKRFYCTDGRPPIHYDLLSIDIGIIPRPLPSFQSSSQELSEYVVGVKPIDLFAKHWGQILVNLQSHDLRTAYTVGIVGGGAGGVELAFAIAYRLRALLREHLGMTEDDEAELVKVVIFNKADSIMPTHSRYHPLYTILMCTIQYYTAHISVLAITSNACLYSAVRKIIERLLLTHHIHLYRNTKITDIQVADHKAHLLDQAGSKYAVDKVFWCTQGVAASWLKDSGLAVNEDNFVLVQVSYLASLTPSAPLSMMLGRG
jgi:selenide,water dikinase